MHYFKKARVLISTLVFIFALVIFADFTGMLPAGLYKFITWFQFVPALLKPALGFAVIVGITFFAGRIYCSFLCPLGYLQDLLIRVRIGKKRRKFKYLQPSIWVRYSLLTLSFLSLFSGTAFLLIILDPYSNFGRIISGLLRPLLILTNNQAAAGLESMQYYFLYPYDLKGITFLTVAFPMSVLILLVYLSIKYGRLYCNLFCPVGTLLGLISRISFFRIYIDEYRCKQCGLCELKCKANCISTKDKNIDFSRCVMCFDCLDICPSGGIKSGRVSRRSDNRIPENTDNKKREFIKNTLLYSAGLSAFSFSARKAMPENLKQRIPVTPPGSFSLDHFHSSCTACHLCVSSCPTQVLQPSFLEYGFTGMLQPRMNYTSSFCNYDCNICTTVCPTGALRETATEKKKLIQLGRAVFKKHDCIVYTNNTDCGACSEHCPTKAVTMKPYGKDLFIPEVHAEFCIGCGACEYACPASPHKAIIVESNKVHQIARKPLEESPDKANPSQEEDFPF